MRILFDSKQLIHKDPFGTLIPGQECTLNIHIPDVAGATGAECILIKDSDGSQINVVMHPSQRKGTYQIYQGLFTLKETGLYFYYFRIFKQDGSFRLFKQGDFTNMEAGEKWQLSCVPVDFTTPDWAKGAIFYQVFPDRFFKAGKCDLTGKLEPYTVHKHWNEEVHWKPTPEGEVLNNDFYGGNFRGITEKMDYIASMGTSILYLNPIGKAFSSHRYDTGDYKTPDPMLGTIEDFSRMCDAAHKRGIKVILDGVYSHTGSDSLYFDKKKTFGGNGAYNSPHSPYYNWYTFHHYPDSYVSWWNFDTLPTVNKMHPDFLNYIIFDENSVVAHWLKLGADGFRLDVVDELPNEFVQMLKKRIREIRPDALLVGEVWEDASNKVAYGVRRRYFTDGVLDSCMNYPYRTAIIEFLRGWDDGKKFRNAIMTIAENYPPQVLVCNLNLLGSHDTPRILTTLVDDFEGTREEYAQRHLTASRKEVARDRLFMASFLQYMVPGAPCLYYADETGMEGFKDPFNRRTYPWGKEDPELLTHYRQLGVLRKEQEALRLGDIQFFHSVNRQLGFSRTYNGHTIKIYVNRNSDPWEVPAGKVLLGRNLRSVAPTWLTIGPMGFCVMEEV